MNEMYILIINDEYARVFDTIKEVDTYLDSLSQMNELHDLKGSWHVAIYIINDETEKNKFLRYWTFHRSTVIE